MFFSLLVGIQYVGIDLVCMRLSWEQQGGSKAHLLKGHCPDQRSHHYASMGDTFRPLFQKSTFHFLLRLIYGLGNLGADLSLF